MSHLTIVDTHDTVRSLKDKLKNASDEAFKTRVKAILLAKQNKKRYEIVESLMVDPSSVSLWVKKYNNKGIEALKSNKGGRPEGNPVWDSEIFTKLAKEIDKGGYWSIPRMQEWITKHYKVNIPEQTVWYRMDKLGYSYKGARPHPVKGDKEKQESFKKGVSFRSWRRV
jgi:transposase